MSNSPMESVGEVTTAGVVAFGTAWADEEYEHFTGYRLGNGQTLIVQSFDDDAEPVLRLVCDKDALEVRWRYRCKQLDLAQLGAMKPFSQTAIDAVLYQDLFLGVELLPLPASEPLELWPCEVEARAEFEARERARKEERAKEREEEMTAEAAAA